MQKENRLRSDTFPILSAGVQRGRNFLKVVQDFASQPLEDFCHYLFPVIESTIGMERKQKKWLVYPLSNTSFLLGLSPL